MAGSANVGSAVGYLDLDISQFMENMRKARDEQEKSKSNFEKAGEKITGIGKSMAGIGKNMTKFVTTPIVGVGTAAVKTSADFESALSKVGAISTDAKDNMDALKEKAIEMGGKTKFSATEAAEAMQYMGMAGWDSSQMLDGLEGIMNLAAADGLDLATTSDIVTDALTAFGLSAKDSGHFADVLASASSNANTNVAMLGESFKYVAPVAGSLGYTAEDTATALGLMANAGIKASQGGTALRTILTNLASPTAEMQTAMEQLGISITNDDGSMKSLDEVMKNLRESFGEMKIPVDEFQSKAQELDTALVDGSITEKEYNKEMQALTERAYGAEGALKAQYAATIAGKEGMSGLLAIVGASDKDYNELSEAIKNSSDVLDENGVKVGQASAMANEMINNLNGQITIIKSSLQTLAIQIGDILLPYISQFAEFLQNLIDKFINMDEGQKKIIVTIAAVVAAIGPVLLVVGNVLKVIGKVISNVTKVMDVIKKVTPIIKSLWALLSANPIAIVITILVILIGTFVTLYNKCEWFRNGVNAIFNKVKEIFTSFGNAITTLFTQTIPNKITSLYNKFINFKNNIISTFKTLPNTMKTIGINIVQGIWNGIQNAKSWMIEKVKGFAGNILGGIKGALGIHSPSRKFRDEVGKMIPLGISAGFEKEMPKATKDMRESLDYNMKKLKSTISDFSVYGKSIVYGDGGYMSATSTSGFDYGRMAGVFREVLENAPIQNNVTVEMEDGDVIMDNERVGRKVAPVVSRVVATGMA